MPSTTGTGTVGLDEPGLGSRREEILDAATALFAEHGFSDTVTQELAEKLHVGKGTIYRCFPSKRELFLAAVDRVMRRMRAHVDAQIAPIEEPLERVAQAIRAYLSFFAEHPQFVELLIQERAHFKDRKKPTYFEHQDNNVVRWRELFRSLMAEGRVRPMPVERITDVLSNLVYGTMFTNHFAGQAKPSDQQASDILDIIYHGVLAPDLSRESPAKAAAEEAVPGDPSASWFGADCGRIDPRGAG
jgi:AcrR family transcriptional regulator